MVSKAKLTPKQIDLICAFTGAWRSGPDLAETLDAPSVQGVHQTAASLVRRGYLKKQWHGVVHYKLTEVGAEYARSIRAVGPPSLMRNLAAILPPGPR